MGLDFTSASGSFNFEYLFRILGPYLELYAPYVKNSTTQIDTYLSQYTPTQLVASSCLISITVSLLVFAVNSLRIRILEDGGIVPVVFSAIRTLPIVQAKVQEEKRKMRRDLLAERSHTIQPLAALPSKGIRADTLCQLLIKKSKDDLQFHDRENCSKLSGAVYMSKIEHRQLLNQVYSMFATSNPLHADVYPSVRQMEAEVVAMTAQMLRGREGPGSPNPDTCGAMTSGGTESILMAMKAARDYARQKRGVRNPELIIARSAHAAYFKAASYFKMRLVALPVDADYRLSGASVQRALTKNTVAVIASAPGFPHGLVDHVEDIAKVCRRANVWLHVDACLGGFVLPFAQKLGRRVPAFDFSVPGVSSMSVDTHKYGLGDKGTSVVLYASPEHRMYQFTSITDWSGGLYISPTMAGSRPGALIATAWAAMVSMGENGYLLSAKELMSLSDRFQEGISSIPELEVIGDPEMCVVAFRTKDHDRVNIYKVNDLLSRKGWHLNALQNPPALHFCFTPNHVDTPVDVVELVLQDLREAVRTVAENPDAVQGGSAPMYGMASAIPDRKMVGEFLVAYQDVMLDP